MNDEPELTELGPEYDPQILAATRQPSGINIGGNVVTQCTEHLPEDQRLLVRWLHTHARENNWEWADVIKNVVYSSSTCYRLWTDKYSYPKGHFKAGERMPLDGQCEKIRRYKRIADQRIAIAHSGFVATSVWTKVDWLCRRSWVRQKIGF